LKWSGTAKFQIKIETCDNYNTNSIHPRLKNINFFSCTKSFEKNSFHVQFNRKHIYSIFITKNQKVFYYQFNHRNFDFIFLFTRRVIVFLNVTLHIKNCRVYLFLRKNKKRF